MHTVAKFLKISKEQFIIDFKKNFNNYDKSQIENIYESIKLPKRATIGSAGYDFYTPVSFTLKPQETINIPTGIRVKINEGWFLAIFPRSGLGFKYRLQLNNTVGVIDSDYFNSDNEGHIFIKITNDSNENKTVELNSGQGFAQGIFMPFGLVEDDDTTDHRNGGFGSTTK
ncbi:MAG: deoxyuridine 5'-triphosphate nucleotidohydrolase [[Clostridium] spiroforme]|uniref:dUTP diphosphatase n=1 Tax=Thomasclavelia spiroformis TaxID=29348 RepID=A0A943EJ37_9FIRM|nr:MULTISPECIES: deoxyuridine 5'-triphosphate nucleotidohydrolase [Thomasclavelia]MBS5587341.1 deoxyuridine 5'-triphosphate nucleotidohydrolase [Thomasclavelia spiroformis]